MKKTCSLDEAARVIGVGPNQFLKIINDHPDTFPGVDTRIHPSNISVSDSALQAFKHLYEDAYSFTGIADRLGVSIKRIQKLTATPGMAFLERSFCSQQVCPTSGRPKAERKFPRQDAEAFIEYCETRSIFKLMQPGVRINAFTYATLENEDIVCACKAYRFKDAVEDGLEPQKYASSGIAPGQYTGKLVFKVWGKKSIIQCFFVLENEDFIRLTAFRPHATPWRGYTPKDGQVDFSRPGIEGTRYEITTGLTQRGTVSFLSAREI